MQMGRVPKPAEHFQWEDLRFEVADMDGKRVDKVIITRENMNNGIKVQSSRFKVQGKQKKFEIQVVNKRLIIDP